MTVLRRFAALAAATALALSLAACGSDDDADNSSDNGNQNEERSLVVYSGRDEALVGPLIDLFEEASGVDVEVRYAGTTELAAQLLEEGDATRAQVFLSQDAGALGALSAEGMFTKLPDSITDLVDEQYTSTDGSWVGLTGRARVIAYDSEKLDAAEVPDDVFELTDPKWKGRFAVVPGNASFQSFVTAMRVSEGEDKARAWLDGIKANEAQIYEGNGAVLTAVNEGAVELGLINHYYWARSEQDPTTLRAQLKFGAPASVSALVNVTGAGILTGAKDSDEASEFVEFLVSEQAQRYFLEKTFEYPLVGNLPGPDGVPALADLGGPDIDLSDLSSLEATVAMITAAGLL